MARTRSTVASDAPAARRISPARAAKQFTRATDSYINFLARVGIGFGADNQSIGGTYDFNPLSRQRQKLDQMYRGSWMVRAAIGCVADDMTREWITFGSELSPEDGANLQRAIKSRFELPKRLNEAIRWGRLYGGGGAYIMIDGQDPATPLRVESIGEDQFNGLTVYDRWMLEPSLNDVVTDQKSKDYGKPRFYTVTISDRIRIHHTRFLRFEGDDLPYWQRIAEMGWGLSVLEPIQDRLVAFDSTTQGAAQLVFKAHLRVHKVPGLRKLITSNSPIYEAFLQQMAMNRFFQTNESITLVDGDDEFDAIQYNFGGLGEMLLQFAQQLSGALQIPLIRLFGQSPVGLNSTGESDWRNYDDGIKAQQETRMRPQIERLLPVVARSEGITLPDDFSFEFAPLRQLSDMEKSDAVGRITAAVVSAFDAGIIGRKTALQEMKQSAEVTGVWSNITDESIEEAEEDPPEPEMFGLPAAGGGKGGQGEPGGTAEVNEPGRAEGGGGSGAPNPGGAKAAPEPRLRVVGDAWAHIADLPIHIETPKGMTRHGRGWSTVMSADYGFLARTNGADSEGVDCYVGPNRDAGRAWVIDQIDAETGAFDEHKAMLGFDSRNLAVAHYVRGFGDGRGTDRLGACTEMSMAEFKDWLATGDLTRPIGMRVPGELLRKSG